MKILLFGSIKEEIGDEFISTERSFEDKMEMRSWLESEYPFLSTKTYAVAINRSIGNDLQPLHEDDEIALLPPFSGG